jgi:hypothetical protein
VPQVRESLPIFETLISIPSIAKKKERKKAEFNCLHNNLLPNQQVQRRKWPARQIRLNSPQGRRYIIPQCKYTEGYFKGTL